MESGALVVRADIEPFDNILTKSNEINVFRIIQECLNNIIKHAHATEASIEIRHADSRLNITVADNGIGMQPLEPGKGSFGLIGIKERLNILNGSIKITDNPPHGTVVYMTIFLHDEH